MSIGVQCTCGKTYRVGDDKAGRRMRCKECGATVEIPAAEDEFGPAQVSLGSRKPQARPRSAQSGKKRGAGKRSPKPVARKKSASDSTVVSKIIYGVVFLASLIVGFVVVQGMFRGNDKPKELQPAGNPVAANGEPQPAGVPDRGNPSSPPKPTYDPAELDRIMRTQWCVIPPTKELVAYKTELKKFVLLPDGSKLVTAGTDEISKTETNHELRLWDVATGKKLASLKLEFKPYGLELSPDGKILAVAGLFDRVLLCGVETLEPLKKFEKIEAYTITFSPDSRFLAGYVESSIRIWDLQTSEMRTFEEKVKFSPDLLNYTLDGKTLVGINSGDSLFGSPAAIMFWDVESGQVHKEIKRSKGDSKIVGCIAGPDSETVSMGTQDGHVQVWNAKTGTQLTAWKAATSVAQLATTKNLKYLATIDRNSDVRLWDFQSQKLLATFGRLEDDKYWSMDQALVDLSSDGKRFAATVHDKKTIGFWDVSFERISKTHDAFVGGNHFVVSAKDLARRTSENPTIVKEFYTGKQIEIHGTAASHFGGDSRVLVNAGLGGSIIFIVCDMKVEPVKGNPRFVQVKGAPRFWENQQLRIRGKLFSTKSSSVLIDECEIVEVGEDPRIKVTAVDITRECVENEVAAEAKYEKKVLLVEGEYIGYEIEREMQVIKLAGYVGAKNRKTHVSVACSKALIERIQKSNLMKGARIQMMGVYFMYEKNKAELLLSTGSMP